MGSRACCAADDCARAHVMSHDVQREIDLAVGVTVLFERGAVVVPSTTIWPLLSYHDVTTLYRTALSRTPSALSTFKPAPSGSWVRTPRTTTLFKLFKQSSRRDSQFTGERKAACRDVVDLVSRRVLHARERGVSNTLLGDQRVRGRRDRIGLDSAVVAATLADSAGVPATPQSYPSGPRPSGVARIWFQVALPLPAAPRGAPSFRSFSTSCRRSSWLFPLPLFVSFVFFFYFFTPTDSPSSVASLALVSLATRTSSSSTSTPIARAACPSRLPRHHVCGRR